MNDLWQRLKKAQKPIWLYGMGDGADKILDRLHDRGVEVSGVFASDGFVRNQQFRGFTVTSYADAKARSGDMIVLVCFGSSREDVLDNIRRIASEQELYAPDVPVIGGGTFDSAYAASHGNELRSVYNMLADEQSRLVFRECVAYRLDGSIAHLFACESDPNEAWSSILQPSDEERLVDLGAFNGDTVTEFLAHTNGRYKHIYAVEPGKKSFARLQTRLGGMDRVDLFNLAAAERTGEIVFNTHGGRNHAAVSASGSDQMSHTRTGNFAQQSHALSGSELSPHTRTASASDQLSHTPTVNGSGRILLVPTDSNVQPPHTHAPSGSKLSPRTHAPSDRDQMSHARIERLPCDSVDNLLGGAAATIIKLDVEGCEAAAIEGARRTIERFRPKIQAACYHRVEDYFALPLQVAAIRNDYRLYMRRFRGVPAWDVNFYFI